MKFGHKKIVLLYLVLSICLSGCDLVLDAFFYQDDPEENTDIVWEIEGTLTYQKTAGNIISLVTEFIKSFVELSEPSSYETLLQIDSLLNLNDTNELFVEPVLNIIKAQYANNQINFSWDIPKRRKSDETAVFIFANGRSLESFELLIPEYITLSTENSEIISLQIKTHEAIILLAPILQATIRIHGEDIDKLANNAPLTKSGYAEWFNPKEISIELKPMSKSTEMMERYAKQSIWWLVGILLIGVGIFLTYNLLIYFKQRR